MIQALTIIETVLLTITGLIMVIGLFSATNKDKKDSVSDATVFIIDIAIVTCILGVLLLWI